MDTPKLEKIVAELRELPGTDEILENAERMLEMLLEKLKMQNSTTNNTQK